MMNGNFRDLTGHGGYSPVCWMLRGLILASIVVSVTNLSAVAQELPINGSPLANQPPNQPIFETGTLLFGSTAAPPPFLSTLFGYAGAPVTYSGTVFLLPERQLTPTAPAPGEPAPVEGLLPPTAYPVPSNVLLPPLVSGASPIQTGDPRAPEIMVKPSLGISQLYTNNPRLTSSTFSDTASHLSPGIVLSADTPHLQGELIYGLDYYKYARAHEQNSLTQDAVGYGLATIVPGSLYVDGRALISELSTAGGAGFTVAPGTLPVGGQSQVMITSLTPIVRQSFGDLVDTELRYSFGMANFGSPSLTGSTPAPSSSLSDVRVNHVALAIAIGRGYGVAASRVTLDATNVGSTSVAQSDQFRGFDDFEYHLSNRFALLARVGYEDFQYGVAGLRFNGPIVKLGARADLAPDSVATLLYGRQDGIWSFEGRYRQQLTASTAILGAYLRSVSSTQQQLLNDLNSSRLDAFGTIVNYDTALPGLANPEFSYAQTDIYRYQLARMGITSDIGRNSFRIFGFLDHRASLINLTSNDTSRGILLEWFRTITPRLTGAASLGYATHVVGNEKTATAGLDLTYQISDAVTFIARYEFMNCQGTLAGTSLQRNLVELGLRGAF